MENPSACPLSPVPGLGTETDDRARQNPGYRNVNLFMPYTDQDAQRAAWRRHYARNKPRYAARNRQVRIDTLAWLDALKGAGVCAECGLSFPGKAMDWHHRDPATKLLCIADMVHNGYGRTRLLEEMVKCDLLCAICHRLHHHH